MSRFAWFSFAALKAPNFHRSLEPVARRSLAVTTLCGIALLGGAPALRAAQTPHALVVSYGGAGEPLDVAAFTSGSNVVVYTAQKPGPVGDVGRHPRTMVPTVDPEFGGAQLTTPTGIAVHPTTGAIYVSDAANRIVRFNADRTFAAQFGTAGSGNGQFNDPAGLCVDAAGNVYVADRGNHRIQKFNNAGTFVAAWGGLGSGNRQFNRPSDVAVDSAGNLYVADTGNHRIQKLNSAGAYVTKWGALGAGNTQFNEPTSVALDKWGLLWVTDYNNNRIVKYTVAGTLVLVSPHFLRTPLAVATSGRGDIYVIGNEGPNNTYAARLLDAAYVTEMASITPDGTYRSGAQINVWLEFSRAVTVTGTPRLQLETGTVDRFATYVSGSGTGFLYFTYTVVAGDSSPDLEFLNKNSLQLNGGTIIDADGHAADVELIFERYDPFYTTLGSVKNIVIDTTVPGAPSTPDLTAATDLGSSNTDNLTSDTTPTFTGTTEPNATIRVYRAGTTLLGSTTATAGGVWTFTVPAAAALANGAHNITARATNSLGNTGAASAALAVTIDTTAPAVTAVSSTTANGTYGLGATIPITVTFNQPVTVNTSGGTPRLTLETGATDRTATYASGSGTATLTFNYTVQSGDNSSDLDYLNTLALALNGGTLRDASGNNATLTLPAPGAAGSLAANKALVISTAVTPPSAPSAPDLAAASDTGVLNNDNLTRDTTPTFTGTAAAGSTVRLFAGVTQVGSATAVGGNWSITTSALAPGTYNFTATAANAGGTSPASGARAITIATLTVDTEAELRSALLAAANGDTIAFAGDITLTADLPAVQRNVTIAGNNHTLDGANAYRGFLVYSGSVTVANLTITHARAIGGAGGLGGGGGAGMGGALFVRTGATVNVNNLSLLSNAAVGGAGGSGVMGGGGGMGGNGAVGGGGLGVGANGGAAGTAGASGIVHGAASGGAGLNGAAGGAQGGGGGGGQSNIGGGGGGVGGGAGTEAGVPPFTSLVRGGAGGFGGGGGAGAVGTMGVGGGGGFGGGGGSAGVIPDVGGAGGNGGFGGGGGASVSLDTGYGRGGFGGGNSSPQAGGGGAGLGGAIFVQDGATLNVTGPLAINGNTVTAGATGGTGATAGSAFGAGAFLQGNGTITFSPAAAQTVTINDVIADQTGSGGTGDNAGAGRLVKNGAGTLVLAAANTYSGGTTLNAGILTITAGNNLGFAGTPITFGGGTLRTTGTFSVGRPTTLGASGGVIEVSSGSFTHSGVVSGTGSLAKTGGGTLILTGANTFTGTTTVNAGTLQIGNGASGALTGPLINNSAVIFNRTGTLAYAGNISGPGSLTKSGSGTVTLSGALSYTGPTTITGGTLAIGGLAHTITAPMTVSNGMLRFEGNASAAALDITNDFGGQTRFAGSSTAGAATIVNNSVGFAYFLDNASAGTATIVNNGTSFTSFEGSATAHGATVVLGNDAFIEIINLTTGGIAIGSLDGGGNIHLGAKTLTTGGLNTSTTLSGVIDGTGGALVKIGTGTLTLTGASTYTGGTTLNAGTLRVNNATGSATGPGTLTLATGATLAGAGRIGGDVIAQAGARTEPGNSIGTLTVGGDYTWRGGGSATFDFELSTTNNTSDRLAIGGAFIRGGAAGALYRFDFGGTGAAGRTYTLATFASTTFAAGNFSYVNLPAGLNGTFSIVGGSLRFTTVAVATAAPVVALTAGANTFAENAAALAIDPALTVTDSDSATLASATVRITTNFSAAQDALAAPTLQGNIAASYDSSTGILTLTSAGATATLAQWQATLRAVTYRNSSDAPSTATRTVTFTANDGDNASSTVSRSIALTAVNDAPTLAGATFALAATDEDTASSGTLVSAILAGVGRADADASALSGLAITATTGNGTWQYSTNGTTWTSVGAVSTNAALLLSSTARIRYTPDNDNAETAALTFRAWDRTSGTASTDTTRNTANTTTNGATTAFSAATAQATLDVTDVNDAPVLTPAAPVLAALGEDDLANTGHTVASIVGARISDVDTGAVDGIAITAAESTGGRWQFSLDGTTWSDVGVVSDDSALLLRSTDRVRFFPDGVDTASASFTHRAWDQTGATAGAHGTKLDSATTGGSTAFSNATDTVTLAVNAANDAPTLSGGPFALTGIDENATAPAGTLVSAILAGVTHADADPGALSGVAVTATTGGGTWQFSTDGVTWTGFGAVSSSAALLLSNDTQVRYLPNGVGETATFTFRAWDQTSGTASTNTTRNTADASVNGGTTAFSTGTAQATIVVGNVNDAPVLAPVAPSLAAITEDDTANSGLTIATLLGASVTDADPAPLAGLALFAQAPANGTWEYSLDAGATWSDVGSVSLSSALLLRSSDRLRFVPDARNSAAPVLSYRAWDQTGATAGAHGTKVDASAAGGTTPFSNATDTATLTVTAINDAPTLTGGPYTFPGTGASAPSSTPTVAELLDATTQADVDGGALAGIAVTATTGAGNWQFSTDGATWTNLGAVSAAAALLLDPSTEVRYLGDGSTSETATITFRAWDQTAGTASTASTRNTADTTTNGGTTAFSTGTAQATIAITALPPAPVVLGVGSPADNAAYTAGESLALTVAFNQAIVVTGTPRLQLNSGAAVFATYASGSGTSTLTFTYAIAAGETAADLDYLSTNALTLNGGTLRNASAVDAILTLPTPGAAGSLAANKNLVIDTTAPAAPTFVAISDDTGPSSTDHITSDSTLILSGTGEPNALITLSRTGSGQIGFTATNGAGAWSFDYTATTLGSGDHVFTATGTDAAGNTSAASTAFLVTIDAVADAPVITAITTDTGASSTDGTTSDATLVLFGTAEANSTVTLNRSGVGVLGTATTNVSGLWSYDYTATTLAAGSYLFTATIVDGAGNTSASSADFPVVIDTTAPDITSATTFAGSYRTALSYAITTASAAVTYSATGLPTGLTLNTTSGVISGEPTQTGTFNVTLGAVDLAGNASTASLTLAIARAIVAVSGITASDKTYDGTTSATISLAGATLGGVFAGDTVTLTGGMGSFSDANVGANKVVTITGLALDGAHAANYQLASSTAIATASINAPPPPPPPLITPVAVSLGDLAHVYDGTPKSAAVSTTTAGIATSITYNGSPTPPTNAGSYTVVASVTAAGYSGSASATLTIARATQTIVFDPATGLRVNDSFTLRATSSAGLSVAFELVSGNAALEAATLTPRDANPLVVRATQPGNENYAPATPIEQTIADIAKLEQTIAFAAPANRKFNAPSFALAATASSGLPIAFALVSGPASVTDGTVTFGGVAGAITIRASQPGNAVFAAAPDVERTFHALPLLAGRFTNLSARARTGTGPRTFITGFVIGGGVPKQLLARAVGPGLAAFGIAAPLADPILRISREGVVVAENANWAGDASVATATERVGAFPLASTSSDAALLTTLNAGPYSTLVASLDARPEDSGVALTELYSADPVVAPTDQHFVNLSVRAEAGVGDDTVIVGFVVNGETPAHLLVRAVGPGLAPFGIDGALLADPRVQLFHGAELLASNDDASDEARAAGAAVGAFALAPGTKDAALMLTVNPGAYSIVLGGAESAPGIALIEVYELP